MKIPTEVWAAFSTGRPELIRPLQGRVKEGQLLDQETQIALLEALSEAATQAQEDRQRLQEVRDKLKGLKLHARGFLSLTDELLDSLG